MANIKVKIDYPISDGTKLKFRTPCESTAVDGLVVTYPIKNGVGNAVKTFTFVDANGKELSGLGNVFSSDVLISVMLDVTKGRAHIKNADTNSYIEDIKKTVKRMDEERQGIFAEAGRSVEECKEATKLAKDAASGVVIIELNTGKKIYLWFGERDKFDKVKDTLPTNTFCIFTDDKSDQEIAEEIARLKEDIEKAKADIESIIDDFDYDGLSTKVDELGQFGLGYAKLITVDQLDTTTAPGWYQISGSMTICDITKNYWFLYVAAYGDGQKHCIQKLYPVQNEKTEITRNRYQSEWSSWRADAVVLGTTPLQLDPSEFDYFVGYGTSGSKEIKITFNRIDYDPDSLNCYAHAIAPLTTTNGSSRECSYATYQLHFYWGSGGYMLDATYTTFDIATGAKSSGALILSRIVGYRR